MMTAKTKTVERLTELDKEYTALLKEIERLERITGGLAAEFNERAMAADSDERSSLSMVQTALWRCYTTLQTVQPRIKNEAKRLQQAD